MMKILLFFIVFSSYLYSSSQVVFVLANTNKSQKAKLTTYEKINNTYTQNSKIIDVNIGENGLAWGRSSLFDLKDYEKDIKKEGDKKAVKGVFKLSWVYGYSKTIDSAMPYTQSTEDLICVDDIDDSNYNKVIETNNKNKIKSYENMLLSSETYEYVIKVEHNTKREKSLGSCIFIHVENPKKHQTSGCTSLKKNDLEELLSWLDIKKEPILIQIDKVSCQSIKSSYPFLDCNL